MISFNTYRRIHKALALIESGALDGLSLGRHDLDEGIYVNVMEIETKVSGVFEMFFASPSCRFAEQKCRSYIFIMQHSSCSFRTRRSLGTIA